MKYYAVAFIMLFSALSSQWAVGSVSHENHAAHAISMSVAHDSMAGHECCPSMKAEVKNTSACTYCGDDCQCNTQCHISASIAVLNSQRLYFQGLSSNSIASVINSLPSTPLVQQERPPKYL